MSGKTSPWHLVLVNVAQFCLEAPRSPEIRASEPVLHSWLTLWSANKMLPVKYVWYLFFCREVTKQTALNDKDRCQSLPSLNAPKNKPNFSCCNWTNSTHPDLQGWQIRTDWGGEYTQSYFYLYYDMSMHMELNVAVSGPDVKRRSVHVSERHPYVALGKKVVALGRCGENMWHLSYKSH